MKHKSNSIHIHVLMNGHNHMKNEDKSRHGSSSAKPSDVLMREHHYSGGIASDVPHYFKGGKTHKVRRFATGGHVDPQMAGDVDPNAEKYRTFRKGGHCYADGGEAKEYGEKSLTGQLRKGGRATHRKHHFAGESVGEYMPHAPQEATSQLKRGGRAKRRMNHSEGESVSEEHHRKGGRAHHYAGEPVADNSVRKERSHGGKTKRSHHYWGQDFIGRLPLIGGLANSISHTVGTLDPHKYGGSEYVARTGGQKAADIFSTLGNLGASVALHSKGGGVHHKHRKYHAAGGAAKVRKGMMTENGRMIRDD